MWHSAPIALLCLCLFALLPSAGAAAQAPEWTVYRASNSGLPDDQVQAVALAGSTVWIGTAKGLARFDGVSWTSYTPETSGLPGPYVTAVEPDGSGGVWVGTTAGLAHFDGDRWQAYRAATSLLPSDDVADLASDGDGRVWVATAKGLARFDGAAWVVFDETNAPVLDHLVRSVAVAPDGAVWAGTFDAFQFTGHLLRFDGVTWTRHRLADHGRPSSFPGALAVDGRGLVWAGLKGTAGGALVRVESGVLDVLDRFNSGLPGGGVLSLSLDGDTVWAGTATGLARFDGDRWRVYDSENSGLPDNAVTAVAVDDRGWVWGGTVATGVAVLHPGAIGTAASPLSDALMKPLLEVGSNPARGVTRIRFGLSMAGRVCVRVYDSIGREAAVLVDGAHASGEHEVRLETSWLVPGTYFVQLTTANSPAVTKTLTVVR